MLVYCLIVLGTIGTGCGTIQCGSSKAQYLEQYSAFIDDATSEDISVTDSRWTIYDERMSVYLLDCYEVFRDEMSLSDKQELFSNAILYYFARYGSHMVRELQNEENPVSVMLMSELSDLWEDPDALMSELTGEEWDEMVEEFLEDLDKWHGKLRQLLKEFE